MKRLLEIYAGELSQIANALDNSVDGSSPAVQEAVRRIRFLAKHADLKIETDFEESIDLDIPDIWLSHLLACLAPGTILTITVPGLDRCNNPTA